MDSFTRVISFGTVSRCLELARSAIHERHPRLERVMGIEPTSSAWKAEVLPLNYTREAFCRYPPNRLRSNPTGLARTGGGGRIRTYEG